MSFGNTAKEPLLDQRQAAKAEARSALNELDKYCQINATLWPSDENLARLTEVLSKLARLYRAREPNVESSRPRTLWGAVSLE
jgi:hypothetical protein